MTAPPSVETGYRLAAAITESIEQNFGSMREYILAVQAECHRQGLMYGFCKIRRIYSRWIADECRRVDVLEGIAEGHRGQDRSYRDDPTGEDAVRNVMRELWK